MQPTAQAEGKGIPITAFCCKGGVYIELYADEEFGEL
jgi:hypothetical protein